MNDPQINGDKWVTCDLADTGTDNFLAIAWDGFHIIDVLVLGQTTPKMNAERFGDFRCHNISNCIIYDAIRGTYKRSIYPMHNLLFLIGNLWDCMVEWHII